MRRPTIMRRGRNLMGKETEAVLSYCTLADVLRRYVPAEVDPDRLTLVTELTIKKAALKVRLRKGDKIDISVPLGEKDRSRATYRVKRVISQDPEKLIAQVELVWEVV